jgi:PAS domain S-box-containing protein/putative nucleotidyltransferase with HDIG domain
MPSSVPADRRARLRAQLGAEQQKELDGILAEAGVQNRLLERVFNNPRVLIAYLDPDFTFRRVNDAYAAADAKDASYFPGKNHFDLFPNEENATIFRQVVRTGQPYAVYAKPFEYPEDPERGTSWWDWVLQPVLEDGTVVALVLMLIDVTDRVLAQRRSEQTEAQYAAIQEAVPSGVFQTDRAGGYVYVNARWLMLSGMAPTEPLGDGWLLAVHPDDRELVTSEWRACVAEERPLELDYRFQRGDGRVFWLQCQAIPARAPTGEVLGWIGACTDITSRKETEEDLRASESRLLEAEHVAHLGHWDWDIVADTLAWSDEIYRVFGLSLQQFGATYEAFLESVHPDDRELVTAAVNAALAGAADYDIEHRIVLPSGEIRFVHEQAEVHRATDGTPVRMLGIVHDNTVHIESERQLTRLNTALRTIRRCNEVLVLAVSEEQLLADMCHAAVEEGGYCFTWVGFKEQDPGQSVRPIAFSGREEGFLHRGPVTWADVPRGRGPIGVAVREGTTQLVRDTLTEPRYELWRDEAVARGFRSVLALPLILDHDVIGALGIYAEQVDAFDLTEVDLLEEFAADLAFGIGRQRDQARIARSLEGTLAAVAGIVEMRDPYTAGHQRRVAELADRMASHLGWVQKEIDTVRVAALVHDVGKIYVPAEILNRPGGLTPLEFDFIRQHPAKGQQILEPIDFGMPVAEITLQHHERLDGSGYPRGLRGAEILPGAQVLAVADVVEAITHLRPYRAALGVEAALDEICQGRGTRFNADAVDACIAVLDGLGWF